jgi:hypothetical protein
MPDSAVPALYNETLTHLHHEDWYEQARAVRLPELALLSTADFLTFHSFHLGK